MKSYEEIAENVLKRRNEYLAEKKIRRSGIIRNVSYFTGIAAAAVSAFMIYNSKILSEIKPDPHQQYNITEHYNTHNPENTLVTSGITVSSVPAETTSSADTAIVSTMVYTTDFPDSLSSVTEAVIIPESSVTAVTETLTYSSVSANYAETHTIAVNTTKPIIHTTANTAKPETYTTADITQSETQTTAVNTTKAIYTTTANNTTKQINHTILPSITKTGIVSPNAPEPETVTTAAPAVTKPTIATDECNEQTTHPAVVPAETRETTHTIDSPCITTSQSISSATTETTTTITALITSAETALIDNPPETVFPETVTSTA
ncbi:MAG: hypothetical protein K2I00_04610 [Ruminococcus sp.]|nr:hypothetical protein [Ruminococcus sp.]